MTVRCYDDLTAIFAFMYGACGTICPLKCQLLVAETMDIEPVEQISPFLQKHFEESVGVRVI